VVVGWREWNTWHFLKSGFLVAFVTIWNMKDCYRCLFLTCYRLVCSRYYSCVRSQDGFVKMLIFERHCSVVRFGSENAVSWIHLGTNVCNREFSCGSFVFGIFSRPKSAAVDRVVFRREAVILCEVFSSTCKLAHRTTKMLFPTFVEQVEGLWDGIVDQNFLFSFFSTSAHKYLHY
jgi:hypothetical protein